MPFKIIKNSFNAGELSEYMAGRTDINKYHNGCSKLINATVLPHGGVVKRPGTEYIALAPNKANLISFEFSVDDALIIEFSNLLLRFYKDGDRVMNTSANLGNSSVNITVFADAGGGEVQVTAVAHGLITNDYTTIAGTTNYNGTFQITKVDADNFKITDTWVADDATGTSTLTVVYLPSGSAVVIGETAHGYSTGDTVRFTTVGGTTELNFNGNHSTEWAITVVTVNSFTLDGTDGDNFTAYTSSGTVASIYEITSPYTSAQSFDIHVTQSADVMYIAHSDVHPKKLSRVSDTNWTIADVGFTGGPFLDENTTAANLMGFARTGGTARSGYYFPAGATGTLTATGGHTPFLGTANDVGTLWLIKHTRDNDNDTDTFAKDTNVVPTLTTYASGAIKIKGDFTATFEPIATGKMAQLWRKEGNGNWQTFRSFRAATSYSGTEEEDDVLYAMTRSDNTINGTLTAKNQVNRGIVKVTAHSSTTVATVEVIDAVLSDNATDNAVTTPMWAEGAWGLYRGYPRTVTFFEDRLWWASSANNPDNLWGSKSSKYENMEFSDIGLDNDAIIAPLKDNEVSQVQWMLARQVMAVGAANKEYRFGASDPDKPVTPSDRKATPQTSFGSDDIQPVILNNAIFFFQRQGRKLMAMKFDAITENFDADDVTLLANTLLESAPTCMAVQRVPDSIIWVVRADGVLLSFTYEPKEEVAGWARHITQNSTGVETPVGFYESVAVIHGSTEDEVWVSVRREINGSTVRYVERFATRFFDQVDEAMMLDSAVVVSSAFTAQNIILASDTVRYNNGQYNSSLYGGVAT